MPKSVATIALIAAFLAGLARSEAQVGYHKQVKQLARKIMVDNAGIRDGHQSFALFHRNRPSKGTVVLVPGLYSGTHQFDKLAPKLYASGYNVYVPRILGSAKQNGPSLARFTNRLHSDVAAFGGPTHIIGMKREGALGALISKIYPVTSYMGIKPVSIRRRVTHKLRSMTAPRLHKLSRGLLGERHTAELEGPVDTGSVHEQVLEHLERTPPAQIFGHKR